MKKEYEKPIVTAVSFVEEEKLMDDDFDYTMSTGDPVEGWE